MDVIIFALIFLTLIMMSTSGRRLALFLYCLALVAMLLLFNHHVTARLDLNF